MSMEILDLRGSALEADLKAYGWRQGIYGWLWIDTWNSQIQSIICSLGWRRERKIESSGNPEQNFWGGINGKRRTKNSKLSFL